MLPEVLSPRLPLLEELFGSTVSFSLESLALFSITPHGGHGILSQHTGMIDVTVVYMPRGRPVLLMFHRTTNHLLCSAR